MSSEPKASPLTALVPHTYSVLPKDSAPSPAAPPAPTTVLTLGNATEELELHGHAEQVLEQRDPNALHALFVLFVKPAAAAEYGLVHHICGEDQGLSEVPTAWPCGRPHPAPSGDTPHWSNAAWSSSRTSFVWRCGV